MAQKGSGFLLFSQDADVFLFCSRYAVFV